MTAEVQLDLKALEEDSEILQRFHAFLGREARLGKTSFGVGVLMQELAKITVAVRQS